MASSTRVIQRRSFVGLEKSRAQSRVYWTGGRRSSGQFSRAFSPLKLAVSVRWRSSGYARARERERKSLKNARQIAGLQDFEFEAIFSLEEPGIIGWLYRNDFIRLWAIAWDCWNISVVWDTNGKGFFRSWEQCVLNVDLFAASYLLCFLSF